MAGEGGKPIHYPRSVVVVCNTMAKCRSAQLRRVWNSEPVEIGELDCFLTIPTYIYCSDETGGFLGTGGGNVASSFASAVCRNGRNVTRSAPRLRTVSRVREVAQSYPLALPREWVR